MNSNYGIWGTCKGNLRRYLTQAQGRDCEGLKRDLGRIRREDSGINLRRVFKGGFEKRSKNTHGWFERYSMGRLRREFKSDWRWIHKEFYRRFATDLCTPTQNPKPTKDPQHIHLHSILYACNVLLAGLDSGRPREYMLHTLTEKILKSSYFLLPKNPRCYNTCWGGACGGCPRTSEAA
jgi:hypothetical protein